MKNREHPIELAGSYDITWQDYSRLGAAQGKTLRFTIIPVAGRAQVSGDGCQRHPGEDPCRCGPRSRPRRRPDARSTPRSTTIWSPAGRRVSSSTTPRSTRSSVRMLPQSAYDHPAQFWANSYTHHHAKYWLDAGWKVDGHGVSPKRVVFVRVGSPKK